MLTRTLSHMTGRVRRPEQCHYAPYQRVLDLYTHTSALFENLLFSASHSFNVCKWGKDDIIQKNEYRYICQRGQEDEGKFAFQIGFGKTFASALDKILHLLSG